MLPFIVIACEEIIIAPPPGYPALQHVAALPDPKFINS